MPDRPRSKHVNPSGSVFKTQASMHEVEKDVFQTEQRLNELKAQLEKRREQHREQIRRSLSSSDPEEREAAERIAEWWEVKRDQPQDTK